MDLTSIFQTMSRLFSEEKFSNWYERFNISVRLVQNILKVTLRHTLTMYGTFILLIHVAWKAFLKIDFLNISCYRYASGNFFSWEICIFDGVRKCQSYTGVYTYQYRGFHDKRITPDEHITLASNIFFVILNCKNNIICLVVSWIFCLFWLLTFRYHHNWIFCIGIRLGISNMQKSRVFVGI